MAWTRHEMAAAYEQTAEIIGRHRPSEDIAAATAARWGIDVEDVLRAVESLRPERRAAS
jgi:hypothetical protein